MSTQQPLGLGQDDRTAAVDNAGFRWGYLFLGYALLVDVIYRAKVRHEAAWDLMGMIVLGGAVCLIYQARHKTLAHGWAMKAALVACLAAVVAAILAMSRAV